MGIGEPTLPAAGEPALAVAVAELAHHGRGRQPRHPPEAQWVTREVLGHDLDPAVAREPARSLWRDHRPVLDLGVPLGARQCLE